MHHIRNESISSVGGIILVLVGLGLIVLAATNCDCYAVAPIFALGGIASVVLGVLLPRAEGDLKISAKEFQMTISSVVASESLTVEEKFDAILDLLRAADSKESGSEEQRTEWGPALASVWLRNIQDSRVRAVMFEDRARQHFADLGYEVEMNPPVAGPWHPDLLVRRGDESRFVEVKARRALSQADLRRTLDMLRTVADGAPVSLVVPLGALSASARGWLRATASNVDLVELPFD